MKNLTQATTKADAENQRQADFGAQNQRASQKNKRSDFCGGLSLRSNSRAFQEIITEE